jgi:hypothetical protein
MADNFNVNEYWLARGKTYYSEERLKSSYYRMQERFLLDVLKATELPVNEILELGCGFGRITRLLAETFPQASIVALDLSTDQLEQAAQYCTGVSNIAFFQYDIYSEAPPPGGNVDLAIAIEVLLHHPNDTVVSLIDRLSFLSTWLVNLDIWSENRGWRPAQHVWIHDYPAIYRGLGMSHTAIPLPARIEGMHQQIFIASRVFDLDSFQFVPDDQLADIIQSYSSTIDQTQLTSTNLHSEHGWVQQLRSTLDELATTIPAGRSFILVDDAQLCQGKPLAGLNAIPFLERDGEYWGPPPDDETAIRELERLCQRGASQIVFAWPAFWWLDHYADFRLACMLRSDKMVVFDLHCEYPDS